MRKYLVLRDSVQGCFKREGKQIYFLSIIGSSNKNSYTEKITNLILLGLYRINKKYTYKVVSLYNFRLLYCCGCQDCFTKGFCPLDDKDDFKVLRNLMNEAKCIIFASPVYAHNITGVMKTFIDRTTASLHLMNYAGKLGITMSTTHKTGQDIVIDYLTKIQTHMGIKNIGNITYSRFNNNNEKEKDFIIESINNINEWINENYSYSSIILENYFNEVRNRYKKISLNFTDSFEVRYWLQPAAAKSVSFQEFASINNTEE